jgi:hypothetical protein
VKKVGLVIGAAGMTTVLLAGGAFGSTDRAVAFSATYAGLAKVKVSGNAATISAKGTGIASVLGRSTIAGKGTGDTSVQPCALWGGTGTITSSRGTVKFTVPHTATACPSTSDQSKISVSGTANVTGGTGKFAKARGRLKFTGKFNRGTGKFTSKFTGRLTV